MSEEGPIRRGIGDWLGRTWEVRALPGERVHIALDGTSTPLTLAAARQLARALFDAATVAQSQAERNAREANR